jgi:hypothetical protein
MDWLQGFYAVIGFLQGPAFKALLAAAIRIVKIIEDLFKGGLIDQTGLDKKAAAMKRMDEEIPDAPAWQKSLAVEMAVAMHKLNGWGDPGDVADPNDILDAWGYRKGPGEDRFR